MTNAVRMLNVKKRTNSKAKMAQYAKQARKGIKGLILKWTDTDPFRENGQIYNTDVSHTNPTQRLIVGEMWRQCQKWILHTEFTWRVTMKVVFTGTARGDKVDEFEFDYTFTLRGNKSDDLNTAMEEALRESLEGNAAFPDGHKNKGIYSHCEFTAQVIGI